jgi:hypothetical protein
MDNSTKICCALALIAIVLSLYSIFTREKYDNIGAGNSIYNTGTGDNGVITVDSSGNLSVHTLGDVSLNTAKTGITTAQAAAITTNTDKYALNSTQTTNIDTISTLTTQIANIESYLTISKPVQLYCALDGWSGTDPATSNPGGVYTSSTDSGTSTTIRPTDGSTFIITDVNPMNNNTDEARVQIVSAFNCRGPSAVEEGDYVFLHSVIIHNQNNCCGDSTYSKVRQQVSTYDNSNNLIWWRKHTDSGTITNNDCTCSLVIRFIKKS